jgi:flagellar basal body rod protein FlgG
MNIGLYQSAASLSALERWQDIVSQNITSSQMTGYRKRTVTFSAEMAGELQSDARTPVGRGAGLGMLFPKINNGINFVNGEALPTRRDLDVAIQGEGFFEIKRPDDSRAYTRGGEFRIGPENTLVTSSGDEVMGTSGSAIPLQPNGGPIAINHDGAITQGLNRVGKISVQKFGDNSKLMPIAGGYFVAGPDANLESVDKPELLQGYLEGSNVSSLREMVDLVLISRAYEANQKVITSVDQQMQKTLDALG